MCVEVLLSTHLQVEGWEYIVETLPGMTLTMELSIEPRWATLAHVYQLP